MPPKQTFKWAPSKNGGPWEKVYMDGTAYIPSKLSDVLFPPSYQNRNPSIAPAPQKAPVATAAAPPAAPKQIAAVDNLILDDFPDEFFGDDDNVLLSSQRVPVAPQPKIAQAPPLPTEAPVAPQPKKAWAAPQPKKVTVAPVPVAPVPVVPVAPAAAPPAVPQEVAAVGTSLLDELPDDFFCDDDNILLASQKSAAERAVDEEKNEIAELARGLSDLGPPSQGEDFGTNFLELHQGGPAVVQAKTVESGSPVKTGNTVVLRNNVVLAKPVKTTATNVFLGGAGVQNQHEGRGAASVQAQPAQRIMEQQPPQELDVITDWMEIMADDDDIVNELKVLSQIHRPSPSAQPEPAQKPASLQVVEVSPIPPRPPPHEFPPSPAALPKDPLAGQPNTGIGSLEAPIEAGLSPQQRQFPLATAGEVDGDPYGYLTLFKNPTIARQREEERLDMMKGKNAMSKPVPKSFQNLLMGGAPVRVPQSKEELLKEREKRESETKERELGLVGVAGNVNVPERAQPFYTKKVTNHVSTGYRRRPPRTADPGPAGRSYVFRGYRHPQASPTGEPYIPLAISRNLERANRLGPQLVQQWLPNPSYEFDLHEIWRWVPECEVPIVVPAAGVPSPFVKGVNAFPKRVLLSAGVWSSWWRAWGLQNYGDSEEMRQFVKHRMNGVQPPHFLAPPRPAPPPQALYEGRNTSLEANRRRAGETMKKPFDFKNVQNRIWIPRRIGEDWDAKYTQCRFEANFIADKESAYQIFQHPTRILRPPLDDTAMEGFLPPGFMRPCEGATGRTFILDMHKSPAPKQEVFNLRVVRVPRVLVDGAAAAEAPENPENLGTAGGVKGGAGVKTVGAVNIAETIHGATSAMTPEERIQSAYAEYPYSELEWINAHMRSYQRVPETLLDGGPLPEVIIFELDKTIFRFAVDERIYPEDVVRRPSTRQDYIILNSKRGGTINYPLYRPEVGPLLSLLHSHPSFRIACTSQAKDIDRTAEVLGLYDIGADQWAEDLRCIRQQMKNKRVWIQLGNIFDYVELNTAVTTSAANRTEQLERIRISNGRAHDSHPLTKRTELSKMLLFDQNYNSTVLRRTLGPTIYESSTGLSVEDFDKGIRQWRKNMQEDIKAGKIVDTSSANWQTSPAPRVGLTRTPRKLPDLPLQPTPSAKRILPKVVTDAAQKARGVAKVSIIDDRFEDYDDPLMSVEESELSQAQAQAQEAVPEEKDKVAASAKLKVESRIRIYNDEVLRDYNREFAYFIVNTDAQPSRDVYVNGVHVPAKSAAGPLPSFAVIEVKGAKYTEDNDEFVNTMSHVAFWWGVGGTDFEPEAGVGGKRGASSPLSAMREKRPKHEDGSRRPEGPSLPTDKSKNRLDGGSKKGGEKDSSTHVEKKALPEIQPLFPEPVQDFLENFKKGLPEIRERKSRGMTLNESEDRLLKIHDNIVMSSREILADDDPDSVKNIATNIWSDTQRVIGQAGAANVNALEIREGIMRVVTDLLYKKPGETNPIPDHIIKWKSRNNTSILAFMISLFEDAAGQILDNNPKRWIFDGLHEYHCEEIEKAMVETQLVGAPPSEVLRNRRCMERILGELSALLNMLGETAPLTNTFNQVEAMRASAETLRPKGHVLKEELGLMETAEYFLDDYDAEALVKLRPLNLREPNFVDSLFKAVTLRREKALAGIKTQRDQPLFGRPVGDYNPNIEEIDMRMYGMAMRIPTRASNSFREDVRILIEYFDKSFDFHVDRLKMMPIVTIHPPNAVEFLHDLWRDIDPKTQSVAAKMFPGPWKAIDRRITFATDELNFARSLLYVQGFTDLMYRTRDVMMNTAAYEILYMALETRNKPGDDELDRPFMAEQIKNLIENRAEESRQTPVKTSGPLIRSFAAALNRIICLDGARMNNGYFERFQDARKRQAQGQPLSEHFNVPNTLKVYDEHVHIIRAFNTRLMSTPSNAELLTSREQAIERATEEWNKAWVKEVPEFEDMHDPTDPIDESFRIILQGLLTKPGAFPDAYPHNPPPPPQLDDVEVSEEDDDSDDAFVVAEDVVESPARVEFDDADIIESPEKPVRKRRRLRSRQWIAKGEGKKNEKTGKAEKAPEAKPATRRGKKAAKATKTDDDLPGQKRKRNTEPRTSNKAAPKKIPKSAEYVEPDDFVSSEPEFIKPRGFESSPSKKGGKTTKRKSVRFVDSGESDSDIEVKPKKSKSRTAKKDAPEQTFKSAEFIEPGDSDFESEKSGHSDGIYDPQSPKYPEPKGAVDPLHQRLISKMPTVMSLLHEMEADKFENERAKFPGRKLNKSPKAKIIAIYNQITQRLIQQDETVRKLSPKARIKYPDIENFNAVVETLVFEIETYSGEKLARKNIIRDAIIQIFQASYPEAFSAVRKRQASKVESDELDQNYDLDWRLRDRMISRRPKSVGDQDGTDVLHALRSKDRLERYHQGKNTKYKESTLEYDGNFFRERKHYVWRWADLSRRLPGIVTPGEFRPVDGDRDKVLNQPLDDLGLPLSKFLTTEWKRLWAIANRYFQVLEIPTELDGGEEVLAEEGDSLYENIQGLPITDVLYEVTADLVLREIQEVFDEEDAAFQAAADLAEQLGEAAPVRPAMLKIDSGYVTDEVDFRKREAEDAESNQTKHGTHERNIAGAALVLGGLRRDRHRQLLYNTEEPLFCADYSTSIMEWALIDAACKAIIEQKERNPEDLWVLYAFDIWGPKEIAKLKKLAAQPHYSLKKRPLGVVKETKKRKNEEDELAKPRSKAEQHAKLIADKKAAAAENISFSTVKKALIAIYEKVYEETAAQQDKAVNFRDRMKIKLPGMPTDSEIEAELVRRLEAIGKKIKSPPKDEATWKIGDDDIPMEIHEGLSSPISNPVPSVPDGRNIKAVAPRQQKVVRQSIHHPKTPAPNSSTEHSKRTKLAATPAFSSSPLTSSPRQVITPTPSGISNPVRVPKPAKQQPSSLQNQVKHGLLSYTKPSVRHIRPLGPAIMYGPINPPPKLTPIELVATESSANIRAKKFLPPREQEKLDQEVADREARRNDREISYGRALAHWGELELEIAEEGYEYQDPILSINMGWEGDSVLIEKLASKVRSGRHTNGIV